MASFDGESLVENDEIFGEAVRAAQFMPGDLTAASMVRLNPAFQDTKKRGKVLVMLQRIKALELASRPSSAFGGRRAEMSWDCFSNALLWGTAIAASWGTWAAECGSGVLIAACIAEVGGLTTVTVVGSAAIGRACD